LFNKLYRHTLRSNSVDYRLEYIDLKDGDESAAYSSLSSAPFRIAELEKADAVLIFASNFIKDHPIVNLRLRKAYRTNNTAVYTANPVETKSADISVDEMIYLPDTEAAFLVALIHAVIDNKWYRNIDDDRANAVKKQLSPASLKEAAKICGIDKERIIGAARALAAAKKPFIIAANI